MDKHEKGPLMNRCVTDIDLGRFGLHGKADVQTIASIEVAYLHNNELSKLAVHFRNGEKRAGKALAGSDAEKMRERIFEEIGKINSLLQKRNCL